MIRLRCALAGGLSSDVPLGAERLAVVAERGEVGGARGGGSAVDLEALGEEVVRDRGREDELAGFRCKTGRQRTTQQ